MSYGKGYITDIAYMIGFYRQQTPAEMVIGCAMGNVATAIPNQAENLSYCELGCGLGYGAIVLAASNPSWHITAVDFNPGHIAAARALAAEAGIANITFLEADLSTLAEDPVGMRLPEFDVVSMHGVWSWVAPAVRAGIVRLLFAKLRAGGIVHISYNALPAWQTAIGTQRMVREAGIRQAQRSDRQVLAGMKTAEALQAAEAWNLAGNPFATAILERTKQAPDSYLAHEFMNEHWSPCFHADVAADMAGAKLDWAASATLTENFLPLTLSEAQREVAAAFDDPIMIELIKDQCLQRGLRHDLYVRGAQRIGAQARDALLSEVVLMLSVPANQFRYEVGLAVGKAEMGRPFYSNVVEALSNGPCSVGELMSLPGRRENTRNPAELIAMMTGSDQALVVTRPGGTPDPGTHRLNHVIAHRLDKMEQAHHPVAMASSRLGSGIRCPVLDLRIVAEMRRCQAEDVDPDPSAMACRIGQGLSDEDRQRLTDTIEGGLTTRSELWRQIGAL